MFGDSARSIGSPEWLQTITREIQAACRDAGTQRMVVACLLSYFVTFLFLERRILPQKGTKRQQAGTESGGLSGGRLRTNLDASFARQAAFCSLSR
jgi:hypothetical protein